jgi:hypothetical protein
MKEKSNFVKFREIFRQNCRDNYRHFRTVPYIFPISFSRNAMLNFRENKNFRFQP